MYSVAQEKISRCLRCPLFEVSGASQTVHCSGLCKRLASDMLLQGVAARALQSSTLCRAAAMQAGQKRKASVLAAAAPPDGTQAAVQPAPRRLRSNAQAALQSEPEPPPAGAPAAVSTPARARRRASKAASACKVEEPSEAPAAVTTPSAKHRARRQARAALAGPVLAPLPVAPCKLEEQPAWTRESIAAAAAHLQRIDSSAPRPWRCAALLRCSMQSAAPYAQHLHLAAT